MASTDGSDELLLAEPETPPDQIVLHLDMDCFFAACERLREPDLEGEPIVIGGGFDSDPPRGAVATASYEAREYEVHSAQPISRALNQLPRRSETAPGTGPSAIYLRGDHEFYKQISGDVMDVVSGRASTIRQLSIDEAYLDISAETSWETVDAFAGEMRDDISDEVGVPASIGVAATMSCAKIACDIGKPDGLQVVEPGDIEPFLAPIDIAKIPGVGPVSAARYEEMGIETAGDLAHLSPQEALEKFGKHGQKLYKRVRGIDPRQVEPVGRRKSISKEKSIEPTADHETLRALIQTLAHRVSERVASKDVRFRTIGVKVVETPFDISTRETTLLGPTDSETLLKTRALDLFKEFEGAELRKVGVRVSKLDFFDGKQIHLDSWDPPAHILADDDGTVLLGQSRLSDFLE